MESKTNAIIVTAIVVIILFIIVVIKIKSDKKWKSLVISSSEKEKGKNSDKKELQGKKPFLAQIPSWGLALLTMFLAFIVLMVVSDIIGGIFRIRESNAAELIFYILYNLIIAAGCFYICKQNPQSIWYVPVLCNIIGIFSAIIEPNFWISSLWIVICSGWALSIIASITGVLIGRKKTVFNNPET